MADTTEQSGVKRKEEGQETQPQSEPAPKKVATKPPPQQHTANGKPIINLRKEGAAKIHYLYNDEGLKKKWHELKDKYTDAIPIEDLGIADNKYDFHWADLAYFDDYKGTGLYVLGSRDDKFAFVKTEGESGYFLPQEFKHIVREYFEEDENLAYGFDQEEEDENDQEGDDDDEYKNEEEDDDDDYDEEADDDD